MRRPYDLPSLTALNCFEAAARKLSFKAAAKELNVTPTAVSHQIRALEAELRQQLFRRQHRGVELTEAGAYLFNAVQRGFEVISDVVRDMRSPGAEDDVVVLASTAISALWLTPRLSGFWRHNPDITISQIVSDAPDIDAAVDLSLHYGTLPPGDDRCALLFHDRICAVGSPDFAARHAITGLPDLQRAPLIHITGANHRWTEWADWLAELGCPPPAGQKIAVNNYMIALQLAKDGIGAVLGWDGLVGGLLEAGELTQLTPERVVSPQCFYLRAHRRASAKALRFRDWLVAPALH
ncbi:LysR substrate-binding domain-containing protein [Tropicibacter oceani]|uniref:LysR substrate-binding domain-containing protein n=1 Tax=Tropicibacter oceani TaxID=3058420 RepID=A0ABY8QM69_9RHOB|nr:LysR substrate-binding domain-containing protein [Tropicibacter oceani]WGW05635.1 LysR substrate-binding domain-containing protein [Tropicibacter oceani]